MSSFAAMKEKREQTMRTIRLLEYEELSDSQRIRMQYEALDSFAALIREAQQEPPRIVGDDQIKHMVNRFLSWRLPKNFNPDAGISFKPDFNEHTAHPMKHEPTGTNLFDAQQAEEMIRYLFVVAQESSKEVMPSEVQERNTTAVEGESRAEPQEKTSAGKLTAEEFEPYAWACSRAFSRVQYALTFHAAASAGTEREIDDLREKVVDRDEEISVLKGEIKALEDGTGATNVQEQHNAQLAAAEAEVRERDDILRNLLAVIHRDGGHHAAEHGLRASGEQAEAAILNERTEVQELREFTERVKTVCAEVRDIAVCDVMFLAAESVLGKGRG